MHSESKVNLYLLSTFNFVLVVTHVYHKLMKCI